MTLTEFCKMITIAPGSKKVPIINLYEEVNGKLNRIDYFSPLTELGPNSRQYDKYRNYEVVGFPSSFNTFGVAIKAPQGNNKQEEHKR